MGKQVLSVFSRSCQNLVFPCRLPQVVRLALMASLSSFRANRMSYSNRSAPTLGTLDAPDQGDILYQGRSLVALEPAELADFRNESLGFVFQFHHLLPEFSALENVMMPGLIARRPRKETRELAENAIEAVGLEHRLGHKPGELSGGEQQRIALARALVLNPPLVLADEVTGNLDEGTGSAIHELLFRLNEERGTTMVVVTHNRSLAAQMPRQLILEDHKVRDCE